MTQSPEDPARKFHRLSKERQLDLNELMREHFCYGQPTKKKKRNPKGKRKSKKGKKK